MDSVGSDAYGSSSASGGGPALRYAVQFSPASFLQTPISVFLEYAGILRPIRSSFYEDEGLTAGGSGGGSGSGHLEHGSAMGSDAVGTSGGGGEVSIRIVGLGDQDGAGAGRLAQQGAVERERDGGAGNDNMDEQDNVGMDRMVGDGEVGGQEGISPSPSPSSMMPTDWTDGDVDDAVGGHHMNESYQRYDMQQVARCIEHILPFSLLLSFVFIRQHLQGFFVTIWIAAVTFKSNDILKKQTALKGERSLLVLIAFMLISALHIVGAYWYRRNDDLLYSLLILPPKAIPSFWHAIFIIIVNDTMVRQAAMVFKCLLLIYYKNSKGRNYRRQGQMLTVVEYLLLVYRALLPAPVWYRFFFNKEYGRLFSSFTTGLYLTFKLSSVVEKVQSFLTALKTLSQKEVQYGSYATIEQVLAAGDLCAICQEKMHAPILLRCKHIFCEDCVTEWLERERSCPLCRALVKPAELKSFGDGSTSLFFQLS